MNIIFCNGGGITILGRLQIALATVIIGTTGCDMGQNSNISKPKLTLAETSETSEISEIILYLEDEPVYTTNNPDSPGFLLALVEGICSEGKLQCRKEFMPWNRAQHFAQTHPNSMIFPLTRTQQREPNYHWVAKIMDVPVTFITIDGTLIQSIEDAKRFSRIGVINGTPQMKLLQDAGLTNIVGLPGDLIYEHLNQKLVNAIFTAQPEAIVAWKAKGYSAELTIGKTLQILPLWIASNQNSPLVDDQFWQSEIHDMLNDGRYQEGFESYFSMF